MKVGPSRRSTSGGTALAVFGSLPALFGVLFAVMQPSLVPLLFCLPLLLGLGVLVWPRRRASLGAGAPRVANGALHLDGAERSQALALGEILWGARSERDGGIELELRDGRRVQLLPERAEDAEKLLLLTSTSVDQRTLVLPLRRMIGTFVGGILWFFALVYPLTILLTVASGGMARVVGASAERIGALVGMLVAPILSVALAWWLAVARRPEVAVGVDGVRVKLGFRGRFLPHEEIRSVEVVRFAPENGQAPYPTHLRVTTEHAGDLDLPIVGWSEADIDRVLVRIREASEARRARKTGLPADAFARRGKDVASWRADLHRLISSEGDFRTQGVTLSDAERVLDDPSAALDLRVGAALALRAVEPEAAERKIRIAATASADPVAERALLAALAEEDAAIDESLSRGEGAPKKTRTA